MKQFHQLSGRGTVLGNLQTQPISIEDDNTPRVENQVNDSGAHFEFNDLLKKLHEIKGIKKDLSTNQKGRKSLNKKASNNDTIDSMR